VTESGSSFPAEVGGSVIVWVRTEFDECGSATLNNKGTGSRRLSTVAEPTGLEPLHRPQVHFIEDVRQPQTAGVVMAPLVPGTSYLWSRVRLAHRICQPFVYSTKNILHHSVVCRL
jgi:hypothetical protein